MYHYPHRIRLRGPWECEPLRRAARPGAAEAPLPAARRMTMPCHWHEGGLTDFAGRVRFTRRFGYPGQIDAGERVWLTFGGVEGSAELWLNDRPLGRHEGAAGSFEHEVTELLATRNRLVVEVEETTGRGGLWGEVALEIRRTAFLRGVRAWTGPEALHVAGEVVGTAERPLDLYVLRDGANVAYTLVEPAPTGQPFDVAVKKGTCMFFGEGDPEVASPKNMHVSFFTVRVELVDAATVWYTVDVLVQALGQAIG